MSTKSLPWMLLLIHLALQSLREHYPIESTVRLDVMRLWSLVSLMIQIPETQKIQTVDLATFFIPAGAVTRAGEIAGFARRLHAVAEHATVRAGISRGAELALGAEKVGPEVFELAEVTFKTTDARLDMPHRMTQATEATAGILESAGKAGALGAEKVVQTFTEKAAEGKNVFSKTSNNC